MATQVFLFGRRTYYTLRDRRSFDCQILELAVALVCHEPHVREEGNLAAGA